MTRLAEVGRPGPQISVLDGGDVDPQTGRLLSVAELRQALHLVLADRETPSATPAGAPDVPAAALNQPPVITSALTSTQQLTQPPGPFVLVLAAQPGAGASTVALALSDAAAATGRGVQLISGHGASTCGLLAAPHVELGAAGTEWRRGRRGDLVLVDRRRTDDLASGWPEAPTPGELLRVLDAPFASPLAQTPPVTVLLVSRATVPGVQRAEQLLGRLEDQRRDAPATSLAVRAPRLLLAVVGPQRWAGPVSASLGTRLRQLQRDGRVVRVPLDRRLDVTGPSADPLPKAVLTAGRALLHHIEADLQLPAGGHSRSFPAQPASVSPITAKDLS